MDSELIDLHKAYITLEDPSEYYYALRYFNSYKEWEEYSKKHKDVEGWRKELEAKIKSDCIGRILEAAKGETRDALSANKFLLDCPWKDTPTKGRPSKQDILYETQRQVDANNLIDNSYALYENWKEQV